MSDALPFSRSCGLLLGVGLICGCGQAHSQQQKPPASATAKQASSRSRLDGVQAKKQDAEPTPQNAVPKVPMARAKPHADPATVAWELAPPRSVTAAIKLVPHDPAAVFLHYCSVCHGADGRGDGQYYSDDLPARPANLTDPKLMKSLSDEHLAQAITGGSAAIGKSPLCPPWGRVFSKEKVAELVAHIRKLPTQQGPVPAEDSDAPSGQK